MPSNPAPMVQPGQGACQPLLADVTGPERSWPAHGSADWRREWAVDGTTEAFSRERPPVLARILGLSRSVQALDTRGAKAGEEGATFDAPPAAPPPAATVDPILVIQADGCWLSSEACTVLLVPSCPARAPVLGPSWS